MVVVVVAISVWNERKRNWVVIRTGFLVLVGGEGKGKFSIFFYFLVKLFGKGSHINSSQSVSEWERENIEEEWGQISSCYLIKFIMLYHVQQQQQQKQ